MNVTLLNTCDSEGGAAIATYRLHRGLRSIGVNSSLLVQKRATDDYTVLGPRTGREKAVAYSRQYLDSLAARRYRQRQDSYFSPALVPDRLPEKCAALRPDIIHLFWMNWGFMRLESLARFTSPIVWTLHDMWPFTGGCHYDSECGRFRESCGRCPILNSSRDQDLSRSVWVRKMKSWAGVPFVAVATSHWMADMARSSSLFRDRRIEVIPNGLDTGKFKPIDKSTARLAFSLPQDKRLILFSAFNPETDRRKGGQLLMKSLETMSLAGWGESAELVIIGASQPENPPNLGLPVHYMGPLHDEISQVMLYSAADVTVAPSMQENLSNTVMESLTCGTPVVAFDIGGMPDMIEHQVNGHLARPFDSNELAEGIMWVLENSERRDLLGQQARKMAVERYHLATVAGRYLALYQDILK